MQDRKQAQIELSKEITTLLDKYQYTGALLVTLERKVYGDETGILLAVTSVVGGLPEAELINQLLAVIDPFVESKQGSFTSKTIFEHNARGNKG